MSPGGAAEPTRTKSHKTIKKTTKLNDKNKQSQTIQPHKHNIKLTNKRLH